MAHYVCPCLNVHIFCGRSQQQSSPAGSPDTWPQSPCDQFFSQSLCPAILDNKGILTSQSCLVATRLVDQWTINTCLSCKKDTHASSAGTTNKILVNTSALLSNATQIRSLLLSPHYSQLYRLILPPSVDNPISTSIENGGSAKSCHLKSVIQSIRQEASNYLLQEQKQMEETVRAFTEQQFALYEALQGKVTNERQSFIDLVSCAYQQKDKTGIKMVIPSPFDHFPSPPTSPDNSGSGSSSDLAVIDRLESQNDGLPKTVVVLSRSSPANQRTLNQRPMNGTPTRNRRHMLTSSDDNAIFDMDGLDDEESAAFPVSEDEDDTDDSTSDEPSHMRKSTSMPFSHKYASSVPVSVPFMTTYNHVNVRQENPTLDDPSQIAASIQALALSMRDDKEMFGDLPRRRLNTGDLVKSRPI